MSKTTEAKARAAAKVANEAAEALSVPVLTPEEAHNTLLLLNRVTTTGMQEAALLVTLGQKFHALKGAYEGPKDG